MNFINEFFDIILTNSLFYITIIITFILGCIVAKRATFFILTFFYSLISIICILLSSSKIITIIISIIFYIFLCIKIKRTSLVYNKNILSFSLIFNLLNFKKENNEKFLGRIIPYGRYQLKHNYKLVKFSDLAAKGATLITGSIGSGKTYGMKSLIKQDLDNGHSVVFFDFKGEKSIITELKEYADNRNIEVYIMSSDYINFNYDPLSSLNTAGKVEALLNTRKWSLDGSDAHYRTSTQLLIQKVINEFEINWNREGNYIIDLYEFVRKYNYEKTLYDAYATLIKILELIITSNIKSALLGENDKNFKFDNNQYLIIFSFVSSNKELANSISSFVFKDLLDTGTKNSFDPGLALYIDEFGTLENSFIIKDILEKGRSCGIQTTICLQDINQIIINTNQAYLNSILGIINTFIIYSGTTKYTAELISGVQINEIDKILMTLRKPYKNKKPTAMYISKYPSIEKEKTIDVFKIIPYTIKENTNIPKVKTSNYTEIYKKENFNSNNEENINSFKMMMETQENKLFDVENINEDVDFNDLL